MTFEELKQKARSLPLEPGVYLMHDASGTIIYVGKAKHLRNRVSQYFQDTASHTPKTRMMVSRIAEFDVIVAVCYTGSLERCLYWNKQRERHVPDAVINRMWRQYLEGGYPSMDEGYDMVTTFDLIIEAMNQGDGFEGDGGNPDKIREAAKKANDSLDEDSNDPVMCYIVESVESVEDIESSNSRWEDRRILRAFGTSKDARKCVENLSSSVGFDMRWLDDMVCFGETFNGQHTKTSLRYTIREVEVD